MARDLSVAKAQLINGLKGIYSTSVYGANATTMSVEELQRVVQSLFADHNRASLAWSDLVSLMGATEARNLLAQTVNQPSADITAQLVSVRAAIVSILDAYQTQYGAGTPSKTFSYSLVGGEFTGGFTDIDLSTGVLNAVKGYCSTLQTAVEAITPVS